MRIGVDGRDFISRKSRGLGCKSCAFDSVGDCGLKSWSCRLPLGEVWREKAWSRFKALYAQEIAGPYPYEEHDTMGR
jgi:hypothetical protein